MLDNAPIDQADESKLRELRRNVSDIAKRDGHFHLETTRQFSCDRFGVRPSHRS